MRPLFLALCKLPSTRLSTRSPADSLPAAVRDPRFAQAMFAMLLLALALAASLAVGGKTWLFAVPAMFMFGRAYGSSSEPCQPADRREYGVGAALANFTPIDRR